VHTSLYHRLRKDTAMILASTICRYLLGLMFAIFGANGLLHFLKLPPPTSALALQFQGAINDSHFMVVVFSLQLIAGLLLLAGRFVPLALIMLAGILTNILLYHMTMDPGGSVPGIVGALLWFFAAQNFRESFRGLFEPQAGPAPRNHPRDVRPARAF
jgi:putative oxidoreductase